MFNSLSDFYRSKEWESFRPIVISERLSPEGLTICEHCGKPIIKAYDLILHHIESLTEENVNDYQVSLNPEDISLVHHKCHNEIHERFGSYNTRHIYLVYGPPGSGKTSFVQSSASGKDLIVDMDSIFEMISINSRYIKPNALKENAFAVRDILLDMIRVRRGRWQNAFIIGGYPRSSERERLCSIYGAEEVFIECNKLECLSRVIDRPEWNVFVEKWFDEFTPPI